MPIKVLSRCWEIDEQKLGEGIVLMNDMLESLGDWVKHEDYGVMKEKLQVVYEQFLDYVANGEEDRARRSEASPFGDSASKTLYNTISRTKQ
jgi:hypothetical protein